MGDEKGLRKSSPSGESSGADFAGLGIQFVAAILIFLFAGQWVDKKLGTDGLFTVIGVFVGAGATEDVLHALKPKAARMARTVKRPLCIVELLSN